MEVHFPTKKVIWSSGLPLNQELRRLFDGSSSPMKLLRLAPVRVIAVVMTAMIVTLVVMNRPSLAADPAKAPGQSTVTWSAQIAPLVYSHCTTCHHPGGAGPFSLLTYRDAVRWAAQMATVTSSRYMPPWLPEHGYGDFKDDRRLSDEDIQLIAKWVKSGMVEGDESAAPKPPQYPQTWQYGTPDLILTVQRPFELPASGTDVFRNFVLPYPLQQTHYVRAMEIRPGSPTIVHHANILIDRTASFRREHPDEWQNGVPGMELEVDTGRDFDPDSSFLFWKPDTPVLIEPDGMPWRLDPGNDLILNMHLKPSGKPDVASAQIGLYFTDQPASRHPMLLQLENDRALDIPAGQREFVVEDTLRLPVDVQLLGIYPHAHYLGRELEAWAILPNQQKKWLIRIPSWDIDRQSVYRYREPVLLPKGSVVHMHYVYDNSAGNVHNPHNPAVRVKAGNRSEDEMAHLWLQVLPVNTSRDGPDPRLLLEEAWMRNELKKEPHDILLLYNLASAIQGQGKYQDAAAVYRQALALHAHDARLLNGLATALESSGNWQEAKEMYAQAITGNSPACDARFNLARLELNHAQPQDAADQLHAMLQQCPPDADAHDGLGVALATEGKPEEAEKEFHAALQIDPNDFTALYNLGDSALQAGRVQEALDLLRAAVKQRPNDLSAHEDLADAYMQSGSAGDAAAQLREAITVAPDAAAPHALLAQVLSSTGQLQEAIAEQKEALRLRASDPDDWNNLGVLEAAAGKTAEAREDFRHALQLAPDHAQARSNLQRLPPS
jgi:Flp pilus assembly protein TadD/mono/diheme cytochrome c family protein